MRSYEPQEPLIIIDVPNAVGPVLQDVVRGWFGKRLRLNYGGGEPEDAPHRHRLGSVVGARPLANICIFGQFDKDHGFGVQDYYPEVTQFITILRDPFEAVVADYMRATFGMAGRMSSKVGSLRDYLRVVKPNMLNHFPHRLTMTNFVDVLERDFIHIGTVASLQASVNRIAGRLGAVAPIDLAPPGALILPAEATPDVRSTYARSHPVEFAVYEMAAALNASPTDP